jgi:hypothetical protein
MKNYLFLTVLSLTFLFLQSCSNDDTVNELQGDERELRIELNSLNDSLPQFDLLSVAVAFVTENESDEVDMTPSNYDTFINEGTLRSYGYSFDTLQPNYEFRTNQPVEGAALSIGVTRDLNSLSKETIYEINVYADDDLEYSFILEIEEGDDIVQKNYNIPY